MTTALVLVGALAGALGGAVTGVYAELWYVQRRNARYAAERAATKDTEDPR